MIRDLPSVELVLTEGLNTQFRPELLSGNFLRVAQNVDSYGQFRSLGKVPGSTRVSNSHAAAVVSLHQFEFTDVDRVRKRHQLSLAALGALGALYRIESSLSLTLLASALGPFTTSITTEPLAEVKLLDRLHLTSQNQINLATGGLKYDGTRVTNWGVRAPGTREIVVQDLDSNSGWSDSADATSSTNTTVRIQGDGSIEVTKDATSSTEAYIEKGGLAMNLSDAGQGLAFVYLFVHPGLIQKLATSGAAVEVRYGGTNLAVDFHSHQFSVGELRVGWNRLSWVVASPDASGGSVNLASIDKLRLRLVFKDATQRTDGGGGSGPATPWRWDHFHKTDESRVSTSVPLTVSVLEGFNTDPIPGGFSTGADGTLSRNTTVKTEGAASYEVDKTGTTEAFVRIQGAGTGPYNFAGATDGKVRFDVFVPTGLLAKLDATTELQFTLGDSGLGNALIWNIATGTALLTEDAWNTVEIELANPTQTAGAGNPNLSAINTFRIDVKLLNIGETVNDVRFDNMRKRTSVPGAVTGTLSYRVTFLTEFGVESNGGFSSAAVTVANGQVDLSALPVSADNQVVARRIYRDLNGDAVYRFVKQIDDNVSLTTTDNVGAASLGEATMPIAGDTDIDSSPPGPLVDVILHEKRLVGIDGAVRFALKFSDVASPERWRLVDEIQLEEEIYALEAHARGTIAYGSDHTYLVSGDGVTTPINVELLNPELGANNFRASAKAKGWNFVLRETELFQVGFPEDPWVVNLSVLDKFKNLQGDSVFIEHDRSRYRVLVFAKTVGSSTYDFVGVYQYGTSGAREVSGSGYGVDPLDLRLGSWYELALPASVDPRCAAVVERTSEKPELWVGGGDGFVYWFQDPAATNWATGLTTAAINAVFESHPVRLGSDHGGRGEPRYLEINANAAAPATWTCTVTLLSHADGAVLASVAFPVTIGAGNTSPIISIPSLGTRAEWCRVKFENAVSGATGTFRSVRLFYIPRGVDFRGPRSA